MSNNTTTFFHQPSNFDHEARHSSFTLYVVNLSLLIPIAVSSPVAVVANGFVLAALWNKSSLRTSCYILLAGLAFTDFCTGLISQPFFVANQLIYLVDPRFNYHDTTSWPTFYRTTKAIGDGLATYFVQVTVSVITMMSVERWLVMTRRSWLTLRRVCFIVALLLFLMLPSAVYYYKNESQFGTAIILILCIIVTSVSYFNVFRIICRHQQQIQANTLAQNTAQPAINLVKYKRSVCSILYIIAIFYMSYLPILIPLIISSFVLTHPDVELLFFNVSALLGFLSSSLNPLIFLCRMKDLRDEVKQLRTRIFCKTTR